jgi:hypothetical protein
MNYRGESGSLIFINIIFNSLGNNSAFAFKIRAIKSRRLVSMRLDLRITEINHISGIIFVSCSLLSIFDQRVGSLAVG